MHRLRYWALIVFSSFCQDSLFFICQALIFKKIYFRIDIYSNIHKIRYTL